MTFCLPFLLETNSFVGLALNFLLYETYGVGEMTIPLGLVVGVKSIWSESLSKGDSSMIQVKNSLMIVLLKGERNLFV